ncbi:hypothetical protein DM860_010274 [Cuscuta australis]|uniref:Homeobox domain-containing protein n=1 Tax=Cuscuta australis TaxID=267555 RepID=A0A328D8I2_9ASTE|nr:hypothetical protein DM860_010274 [Cuscuta australis]
MTVGISPSRPTPSPAAASAPSFPAPSPPPPAGSLPHLRGHDYIALNRHLAAVAEQNKREFAGNQVVVSSRWNPTPEQLQMLEELYRRGTRTPSADQIQQITAQLRKHGKIEGKNVFYWFQNHKARERQKRRRQLEAAEAAAAGGPAADSDKSSLANNMDNNSEGKDSGANRRGCEVDEQQTINLSSTHTSLNAEKSKSVQMGTNENKDGADEIMQQKRSSREKSATWSNQISSPPSHHRHLIVAATDHPTSSSSSSSTGTATPFLHQPPHHPNFGFPVDPPNDYDAGCGPRTLQLFPLGRGDGCGNGDNNPTAPGNPAGSRNTRNHYQFFEFLPLKN